MERSKLFAIVGSLCLALVIAALPFAAACAAPAPTPVPTPTPAHKDFPADVFTCPFGGTSYVIAQGVEAMFFKEHPWLRPISRVTPGNTWNMKTMLTEPERRDHTIWCADTPSLWQAENGAGIFEGEKYDLSHIKYLVNHGACVAYMLTLDPNIKTVYDLDGKHMALGKPAGTMGQAFSWIITVGGELEEKVKIDFLGHAEAGNAVMDGLADACHGYSWGNPADLTRAVPTGFVMQMLESGRKVYFIDISEEVLDKLRDVKGFPFAWRQLPANSLKQQTEPIGVASWYGWWMAWDTFPEEAAYEYVKFILDHFDEYQECHGLTKSHTRESLAYGPMEKFHPGAIRAFKEYGIEPRM